VGGERRRAPRCSSASRRIGVAAIAIHGRTRKRGLHRRKRLELHRQRQGRAEDSGMGQRRRPRTAADAGAPCSRPRPSTAWMIGRAALHKPVSSSATIQSLAARRACDQRGGAAASRPCSVYLSKIDGAPQTRPVGSCTRPARLIGWFSKGIAHGERISATASPTSPRWRRRNGFVGRCAAIR